MDAKPGWSLTGSYPREGRNSTFGLVYAVVIASETFVAHPHGYSALMSALVLIAGGFIGRAALKARSILGAVTAALSLLWIAPLINKSIFESVDLTFMLAHSALALLVAVGAFTYLKN